MPNVDGGSLVTNYCRECERLEGELEQYRRILKKFQAIYGEAMVQLAMGSDLDEWPVPITLLRVASMALDDEDMARIAREATDGD